MITAHNCFAAVAQGPAWLASRVRRLFQLLAGLRYDGSMPGGVCAYQAHDFDLLCIKFASSKLHHVLDHASTCKSFTSAQSLAKQTHTYLHSKSGLDPGNRKA
eukprot:7512340-Pyramimonas_sp.AAC.1